MSAADEDWRSGPKVPFGKEVSEPSASTGQPRVLFGSPRRPEPPADEPRIIGGGIVRQRIPCTTADLRAIEPDAPEAQLAQALRIVNSINFDDHEFDDVVRFGTALQELHGRLAEQQLVLAGNERLIEAKRLSAELLRQLEELDPERLFSTDRGLISGIRAALSRSASPQAFREGTASVVRNAAALKERLPDYRDLGREGAVLKRRMTTLTVALQAHLLAGRFLIRHLDAAASSVAPGNPHLISQKDALEVRLTALASTLSSVTVGAQILETLVSTIGAARKFAEEIVDAELPAWQTACAAALAARLDGRSYELSGVRRHYEKIVNILKQRNTT
ncbi:hypothetical protein [Agrobacterium sp. P15N1-A]|uniref:hypothetical protein n=1 Tax=Agrobacterium sp. P15N1-A TaxID=3342820 RepID=UPI0037D34A98